jgi:hypothetical protein
MWSAAAQGRGQFARSWTSTSISSNRPDDVARGPVVRGAAMGDVEVVVAEETTGWR